mgnify:FL=1
MKRTIMTYGGYFERFIMTLTLNERRKDRLPVKFIKHIAQGIYELRINVNGLAHRVFFIFDVDSIVILFNGFTKKSMKTPRYEIERAIRLKKEYYADKRSQNKEL